MQEKIQVDIIIPIYNAPDELIRCLDSVYKYTDLQTNRLILIDDNSPDGRIGEILQQQPKDAIIVRNDCNKGFAANINIGMNQSKTNDVILLNSDTEVTENWLDKIVACAYSKDDIGIVTPVSNNATICSVPEFLGEGDLPDNVSLGKMAKLVECSSMKLYPEISVAHGFCMYIKREVINAVGEFDADTFQRGYGEENDFCFRAQNQGYRCVECDDTFIYHEGTKSFLSEEKIKNIREHEEILRKRYPHNMFQNDLYVRTNPNKKVCENLSIYLDINDRSTILIKNQKPEKHGDNKEYNFCYTWKTGQVTNIKLFTAESSYYWKFEADNISEEVLWNNIKNAFRVAKEITSIEELDGVSQIPTVEIKPFDSIFLYEHLIERKCIYRNFKGFAHDRLLFDLKKSFFANIVSYMQIKLDKILFQLKQEIWLIRNYKYRHS